MKLNRSLAGYGRVFVPVLFVLVMLGALVRVPATAQEPVLPPTAPNANAGLELFAARCANCHGPQGGGDGEMVPQLPAPPIAFNAPDYRRNAQPAELFQTITNGRLEQGMPPFGPTSSNPIDEDGRWALLAAIYTLATPPEAIASGEGLFADNCSACHGESGQGDGPGAGDFAAPLTDLTAVNYWFNRSNADVFTAMQQAEGHDYTLGDDELWDTIDYARTFSFDFADPNAPIEMALITGSVTNGTTGAIPTGLEAQLRAFTPEFNQTLTLSAPVDADGSFSFNLTDVPANWVYVTSVVYDDLSYSSSPDQLDPASPVLDLPVTVFEKSTDPAAITVEQIHVIMDFFEDRVFVNEVYVFNNNDTAVFVGQSGDPAQGTVEVVLPTGAENVSFQRSFGTFENFLPANELFPTDRGYADVVPLRPGPSSMNLLVRYDLPYEPGMTIAHPVYYDVARATAMLPDVGVELDNDAWTPQDATQMGTAGTFLNYLSAGIAADEALNFTLAGRPQAVANTAGAVVPVRDNTLELVIGAIVLAAVVVGGFLAVRNWRQAEDDEAWEEEEEAVAADPQALLQAIANLDDAYDAGQIDDQTYETRRAELLAELTAVWPA